MAEEGLNEFFERPLAPAEEGVLLALRRPMTPRQALPLSDKDRLLDPAAMSTETGWCVMDDGVGYVAVRTPMPGTTAAMWDWWFDWQRRDPRRYQVWYPPAHLGSPTPRRPSHARSPTGERSTIPTRTSGWGAEVLRIDFMDPVDLGFSPDVLRRPEARERSSRASRDHPSATFSTP